MTIQKPMTLQEAKSIARHLGLTLRQLRSGNYRVNFRDGNEPRPTTRTISKAPSTPQLRWPVSEHCELQPTLSRSPRDDCRLCHNSSGRDEQMFGAKQQIPH
jgi:hypothetical protein